MAKRIDQVPDLFVGAAQQTPEIERENVDGTHPAGPILARIVDDLDGVGLRVVHLPIRDRPSQLTARQGGLLEFHRDVGVASLRRRIEVSPLAGVGIVEGRGNQRDVTGRIDVDLPSGLDLIDEGLVDAQGRAELIRRFRWARRQRVTAPRGGVRIGSGRVLGGDVRTSGGRVPRTRGDRVPRGGACIGGGRDSRRARRDRRHRIGGRRPTHRRRGDRRAHGEQRGRREQERTNDPRPGALSNHLAFGPFHGGIFLI